MLPMCLPPGSGSPSDGGQSSPRRVCTLGTAISAPRYIPRFRLVDLDPDETCLRFSDNALEPLELYAPSVEGVAQVGRWVGNEHGK